MKLSFVCTVDEGLNNSKNRFGLCLAWSSIIRQVVLGKFIGQVRVIVADSKLVVQSIRG